MSNGYQSSNYGGLCSWLRTRLVLTLAGIMFMGVLLGLSLGLGSVGNFAVAAEALGFAGGSGTATDPYLVSSAEELDLVRQHLDKHFLQTSDIDLGQYSNWEPIGSLNMAGAELLPEHIDGFTGTYDGGGYAISGLRINTPDSDYAVGLFGLIETPGILRNLELVNVDIHGGDPVAGAVGFLAGGLIENVHVTGSIRGYSALGGIVGIAVGMGVMDFEEVISGLGPMTAMPESPTVSIRNSTSDASITGESAFSEVVGGLVGMAFLVGIEDSQAAGTVSGNEFVGGMAGMLFASDIENSYTSSSTHGDESVGGLVGVAMAGSLINNSQASGEVTGEQIIGGLVGLLMEGSTVLHSYSSGHVRGLESVGGLVGGITEQSSVDRSSTSSTVSGEDVSGGLAGIVMDGGSIQNSFATGSVYGDGLIGGLAGGLMQGSIVNSYAVGRVEGTEAIGGLVGYAENGSIDASYYDQDTTGQTDADKGTPLTTTEMQSQESYQGWDFVTIWSIDEGSSYPYLQEPPSKSR